MKVHSDGIPIFNAIKRGCQLVTEPCPFCKPTDRQPQAVVHFHGAEGEMPGHLAHRVKHCTKKSVVEIEGQQVSNERGYYLYWDGSEEPPISKNKVKLKWEQALRAMLVDFRQKNPNDNRSDRELLESLMEHFYESGIVKKDANGKWIMPDFEGTFPLIQ